MSLKFFSSLAIGLALTTVPAAAQPNRPPTPPAAPAAAVPASSTPDGPERTTAAFGDWTVTCLARPAGQTGRQCEMTQSAQTQQQQTLSILALGRVARDQPMRVVARLPVHVQVANAARLVFEGPSPQDQALTLPFRSCSAVPAVSGCYAELELRDEAVRRMRLRPADQAGKLEWREFGGQEISVPVSFRGFAAALDMLGREGS
jgi:invasion protein IalB